MLAQTAAADERNFTLLERELEYLAAIWPGDYDNRETLAFDASVGKNDMDSGSHLRVHSQIRRVDMPALSDYVLYVEEYKHNDPTSIFRQRLYVLSADEVEKAIRLKLMFLKDGKSVLGAHNDAARLTGITSDAISSLEGCDVFIRRDGDWLAGSMKSKTCMFGEGNKRRYSDYQLRVTPGQYWFRDRILNAATDEPMEQVAGFSWHQLEQARWFSCMMISRENPRGLRS